MDGIDPNSPGAAGLISAIGVALYGEQFKPQLAVALGVRPDTVRHWCNGRETPPAGVWTHLGQMIGERHADLLALQRAVIERAQIEEAHSRR